MLHMLQWLYTYVAKVCLQCFICVFEWMLRVCFIWMLQVYYLDIAYVFAIIFKCFPGDFLQVFLKLVSSVSSAFRYMMQVLHLDF
jgi:hypothetical protein